MPKRLLLSRRKGFDLQALSLATNGLPAVNCARPGKWGNPFKAGEVALRGGPGEALTFVYFSQEGDPPPEVVTIASQAEAVEHYRHWLAYHLAAPWLAATLREQLDGLRGKNLACWCKPGEPCHVDVLLEIANG